MHISVLVAACCNAVVCMDSQRSIFLMSFIPTSVSYFISFHFAINAWNACALVPCYPTEPVKKYSGLFWALN